MKILTKKIFREIRFNKLRSAIIILTVFTAISLGIGFVNMVSSGYASVAANDKFLNNADLRVRLTEYISEDNVSSLLNESEKEAADVSGLEGRVFEYASVIYKEKLFNAYLIGVDLGTNEINTLKLRSGKLPLVNQVLVEQHFGAGQIGGPGAELNEELTINFKDKAISVTIAGFVADSEYIFVVDEQTDVLTLGGLCIIYMPLIMLHEKFNTSGVNEILVRTNERSHSASQIADQVLSNTLGESMIQTVIYWDETADKRMMDLRFNAIEKLGIIFSLFSLVGGSIAIYNSLSKLIMSQRTYIGLYGALGAKNIAILGHYVGFGVTLGIIGILTGWIGAAFVNFGVINIGINMMLGLVTTTVGFDLPVWFGGTFLTLAIIVIFSILATLPVIRLTPNEAMKAPYSTSEIGGEPFLERFLRPIGFLRNFSSNIPLRTVFMNKRRSFSTALVVAASMVILVVSTSLMYDYVLGVDQNYKDYEKYDVQVIMHPTSEIAIKNWVQQNLSGIINAEGVINTEVWVGSKRIPLQAFHENTTLREFHVIKGKKDLTKDKILVGSILARDLGLDLGDHLTLTFDPTVSLDVEIVGITGELIDNSILWTIEGLKERTPDVQGIGISENVTGFVFEYDSNITDEDKAKLKQQIQEKYHTFVYTDSNEAVEMINELMGMFTQILLVVVFLGLATLIIFSFSSMSLAMMGREMEFIALRAMGSRARTILKIIFLENFLFGAFGLLIGIPISASILRPAYNFVFPDIYLPTVIPDWLWIIVFVLIIFCVFLSTSFLAWQTWRKSLPDMLYNRMVS
ncbi:MAG: FtsX-like permease family protein [Candidatus Hodarchaeota archaeon]